MPLCVNGLRLGPWWHPVSEHPIYIKLNCGGSANFKIRQFKIQLYSLRNWNINLDNILPGKKENLNSITGSKSHFLKCMASQHLSSLSRFLLWSRRQVPVPGQLVPIHANTCKVKVCDFFCAALSVLCSFSCVISTY